jgi:hypothetical protein
MSSKENIYAATPLYPPTPTQPASTSHTDMSVSESSDTSAQSGHRGFMYQIKKNKYDLGDYLMELTSCNKSSGPSMTPQTNRVLVLYSKRRCVTAIDIKLHEFDGGEWGALLSGRFTPKRIRSATHLRIRILTVSRNQC